jgi:tripartite ATP-independent transporter DctM subunit
MEHGVALAMAFVALIGILAGYRVAFVLAGSAALFILLTDTPTSFFKLILSRIYSNVLSNWLLVAIPMFIFMGLLLEKSGVAERSLKAAQRLLGGSPRGMAISVLLVGILLAASSGIVGASVVLLAVLGLPQLQRAGIDDATSSGLIVSSGTLAILMPPSIMLIVLGDQLKVPIGDMFTGAIIPGFLLAVLYAAYAIWRTRNLRQQNPEHGSALWVAAWDIVPLVLLIAVVLGSIISGVATPTEASGLGALGAMVLAFAHGRFSGRLLMASARDTVVSTTMVFAVLIGATCFSAVFRKVGGDEAIHAMVTSFGTEPWTILIVIMAAIFLLGFVLDWLEITLILMPIFAPVIIALDFGNGLAGTTLMLWFGILVALNLQTSFLTPPFGFSLFYFRGAVGDGVATAQIYRGIIPFIALQFAALGLLLAFPWLVIGMN